MARAKTQTAADTPATSPAVPAAIAARPRPIVLPPGPLCPYCHRPTVGRREEFFNRYTCPEGCAFQVKQQRPDMQRRIDAAREETEFSARP